MYVPIDFILHCITSVKFYLKTYKWVKAQKWLFYCWCEVYNNIKLTCCRRVRIIEAKRSVLLPKIYVDISKPFRKPYKGKIKVSAGKLTGTFRLFSGLENQLCCCIGDKNGSHRGLSWHLNRTLGILSTKSPGKKK